MISINKRKFKEQFRRKMNNLYTQSIEEANNEEIFNVLCCVIKDMISKDWIGTRVYKEKAVFYRKARARNGRYVCCTESLYKG